MARGKSSDSVKNHLQKGRKKRPGIHSKCKSSVSKSSKNYRKAYKSQGR